MFQRLSRPRVRLDAGEAGKGKFMLEGWRCTAVLETIPRSDKPSTGESGPSRSCSGSESG